MATSALLRARYGQKGEHVVLEFGEAYEVDGYRIELQPAGHILGSAMVHVTRLLDGATLLYTGDFKLRSSPTCEAPRVKPADLLIMETTFGLPRYVFPSYSAIQEQVVRWCRAALENGQVPILQGYSLGKAQEILQLLQGGGFKILVHETVGRICAVYESQGVVFPEYGILKERETQGHVLVIPPNASSPLGSQFVAAMISGWGMDPRARYRSRTEEVFPLSDHADYPDLVKLVEMVRPRVTYTTHGFAAEFARDLRERGWTAWTLEGRDQLDLGLAFEQSS